MMSHSKTLAKMIDENTAHIRNTDFKGSFMSELDLKNGGKTFYKIQTGLKSYVDCEVSLSPSYWTGFR